MINRGALRIDKCKTIVIDALDEMLDIGFRDQLCDICKFWHVPEEDELVEEAAAPVAAPVAVEAAAAPAAESAAPTPPAAEQEVTANSPAAEEHAGWAVYRAAVEDVPVLAEEAAAPAHDNVREVTASRRESAASCLQVVILTSTLPPAVLELADRIMVEPVRVVPAQNHYSLENVRQFYIAVDQEEWKLDTLCDLYETLAVTPALIYVNTRRKADWLTNKMAERDFAIGGVHTDMGSADRDRVLRDFRSGSIKLLVSTDNALSPGAFRHMDATKVVINYDLPTNSENYIHRVGWPRRGGRFRRRLVAINFLTTGDVRYLRDIEELYDVSPCGYSSGSSQHVVWF
jgi:superfamily II DNA/RNA helicase